MEGFSSRMDKIEKLLKKSVKWSKRDSSDSE
jgi:hypothetical protein